DHAASEIAEVGVGIAASGRTVLTRHVLQEQIPWLVAPHQHRSDVAYHRSDKVLGFKGIRGAYRNGLLAQGRVDTAHHLALSIEVAKLLIDSTVQPQVVVELVKLETAQPVRLCCLRHLEA